jgi:hypothetical protein
MPSEDQGAIEIAPLFSSLLLDYSSRRELPPVPPQELVVGGGLDDQIT